MNTKISKSKQPVRLFCKTIKKSIENCLRPIKEIVGNNIGAVFCLDELFKMNLFIVFVIFSFAIEGTLFPVMG